MYSVLLNENAIAPSRATAGSAGYDFYLPNDITILPHETLTIPLGVAMFPDENEHWVLLMFMRSSIGIKKHLMLANGTGVIDCDYQREIMCAIYNYGDDAISMKKGERICQGVFVNYLTSKDYVNTVRVGGIGSTGK